jgi:hypothetical protein
MSKFSQKPTKAKNADQATLTNSTVENESPKRKVNKFAGMAERIKYVEPVIIPGYKIRG